MKDGGGRTFIPDQISSRLLAVAMSLQPAIRVISGEESTFQSAAVSWPWPIIMFSVSS